MVFFSVKNLNTFLRAILFVALVSGCSRELNECNGPEMNVDELESLRETIDTTGPRAFLVVPNPIDATKEVSILATDSRLDSIMDPFQLSSLLSPSRLENTFLKIRIKTIKDELSTLASPNTKDGGFDYSVNDVHYSEVMAYYALNGMKRYVEQLGFPVLQNRPLYVMVRGNDENTPKDEVNAFYLHARRDSSQPRKMILYGDTPHTPGVDRDVYWHEFGHLFNESISGDVGIDLAGENGAAFTEGSALHECLADYLAESLSDRGYIGKWIGRNFSNVKAGNPLRTALKNDDDKNTFASVANFDSSGKNFDRYRMAEWCTRVLWDIRSQFVNETSKRGAFLSDRLIFSAVGLLKKDTSVRQFKEALSTADNEMYCGLHAKSINKAFESRGFTDAPTLATPLQVSSSASVYAIENDELVKPTSLAGNSVYFNVKITNPNSSTARNVRLTLEALDENLIPITSVQGYGDLAGGSSILISDKAGLSSFIYSVNATIPTSSKATRIKYRLKVQMENGPIAVTTGDLGL